MHQQYVASEDDFHDAHSSIVKKRRAWGLHKQLNKLRYKIALKFVNMPPSGSKSLLALLQTKLAEPFQGLGTSQH